MTGQWEPYVEPAAAAIDPDVFDEADPHRGSLAYEFRREVACDTARRVLAVVGPLIAEDTRERVVAAAGRAVQRECSTDERESARQAMMDGLIAAAEEQERPSIAEWLRGVR